MLREQWAEQGGSFFMVKGLPKGSSPVSRMDSESFPVLHLIEICGGPPDHGPSQASQPFLARHHRLNILISLNLCIHFFFKEHTKGHVCSPTSGFTVKTAAVFSKIPQIPRCLVPFFVGDPIFHQPSGHEIAHALTKMQRWRCVEIPWLVRIPRTQLPIRTSENVPPLRG